MKKMVIANWKMNFLVQDASDFMRKMIEKFKPQDEIEVVVAPTFTLIPALNEQLKESGRKDIALAAQNCYWRDSGAFTGEVAAAQLSGLVGYVLIGHSERRHIMNEPESEIRAKVAAALRNNLTPVLCVGETADQREFNETSDVLYDQLISGLSEVSSEQVKDVVIAYEPVWAISTFVGADGSGAKQCSPEDMKAAIMIVRRHIEHLYGEEVGRAIRVLFGGSVNPDNIAGCAPVAGVDGFLVGGASLKIEALCEVLLGVEKFSEKQDKNKENE